MPNWVTNCLTVTGDETHLNQVAEAVRPVRHQPGPAAPTDSVDEAGENGPISFQRIIPRPASEDDDWYKWNVRNWGTKWDACHPDMTRSPGELTFTFDTAWSPPLPVIGELSVQHPDVHVHLAYEEEQGWGGEIAFLAGEVTHEDEYDIPSSHQERVDRNGSCWCGPDNPVFRDCRYFEVLDLVENGDLHLPQGVIDIVRGLSPNWQGTTRELVDASCSIDAEHRTVVVPS